MLTTLLKTISTTVSGWTIILIMHHIFQKRRSFFTGILKCNFMNHQHLVYEELATISTEDLQHTIGNIVHNHQSKDEISEKSNATQLLKNIRTLCAPLGFTNEAAAEARSKTFSLWVTFGPNQYSLILTL